ncbi:hypothetical protein GCM10010466_31210 [Planomonospora alba]|uniref:ABC transporter domain-containing protein n=1 Tax=Planomonospora alba TaxID=161354 RepID=A0ABP6N6F8_9ACTN
MLALDRVSPDIRAGELIGLLGPNGAGKSTLINLFAGLRRPASGTVELFGGSPLDPARRRGIGVTPQETGLLLGLGVLVVGAAPFMLMGPFIGFTLASKAAVAVTGPRGRGGGPSRSGRPFR